MSAINVGALLDDVAVPRTVPVLARCRLLSSPSIWVMSEPVLYTPRHHWASGRSRTCQPDPSGVCAK